MLGFLSGMRKQENSSVRDGIQLQIEMNQAAIVPITTAAWFYDFAMQKHSKTGDVPISRLCKATEKNAQKLHAP